MRNRIAFSVAVLLVAFSGLGSAAPMHSDEEKITVGFGHSFLNGSVSNGVSDSSIGRELTKGLYGRFKVSDKIGVSLERNTYKGATSTASADTKLLDIRADYKLSDQFSVVLGSRKHDTVSSSGGLTDSVQTSKALYGLSFTERLGRKWQGNLSFLNSGLSSELKVGADYSLSHNMNVGVNYKKYIESGPVNTLKLNGFELTMSHRF